MSSGSAGRRELVFCHECEEEFWKDEHGLTCPSCTSDFTEVIEQGHDPREPEDPPSPPMDTHPLRSHYPWASDPQDAPDPDEDDVRRFEYHSTNGGVHFTSTFVTSSTSSTRRSNRVDQEFGGEPPGNPFNLLGQMLSGMARPQQYPTHQYGNHTRPQASPFGSSSFPGRPGPGMPGMEQGRQPGQFYTSTGPGFMFSTTGGPGNMDREEMPTNDLHQMLGTLFNTIHPQGTNAGGNGFHTILSQILNPANAQHGDAVYSNEAFDRVLSQLMEQHQSGNAPGPASEAAIAALPRKPVGAAELGEEGKAECSICMDSVTLGVEINVLPCNHWFHPDCVKAWLSEHDTCPVCRAGIMPKEGDGNAPRQPSQMPLHNEDPALVARRQSGSRGNPFIVPESPSRERRLPSFRRHSSGAGSPQNSTPGAFPHDPDEQQGSGGGSSNSGGLTGRVRRMFGSNDSDSPSSKRSSGGPS